MTQLKAAISKALAYLEPPTSEIGITAARATLKSAQTQAAAPTMQDTIDALRSQVEYLDKIVEDQAAVKPVADDIVAGALYDFLGYLTTRRTRITMSDRDDAGAAIDALVDWSKTRKINLTEALVRDWNAYTSPPDHAGLLRDALSNLNDLADMKNAEIDELKEAMRMALEALREATSYTSCASWSPSMTDECNAAIAALEGALK